MPRLLSVRSRATPLTSLEITVLTIDEELVETLGRIAVATPPTPPAAGDWQARRASMRQHVRQPGHRVIPRRACRNSRLLHPVLRRTRLVPADVQAIDDTERGGGLRPCPGARVALMGDSAGGGLAAAATVICRDRGIESLAAQILIYPMLDDRTVSVAPGIERFLAWTVADNLTGWQAYLGTDFGTSDVPASASPARTESLDALPCAYLEVGQLDLFCPETVAYAQRLIAHDVPVRLSVIPGAIHGFDQFAPSSRLARAAFAERVAFLRAL